MSANVGTAESPIEQLLNFGEALSTSTAISSVFSHSSWRTRPDRTARRGVFANAGAGEPNRPFVEVICEGRRLSCRLPSRTGAAAKRVLRRASPSLFGSWRCSPRSSK